MNAIEVVVDIAQSITINETPKILKTIALTMGLSDWDESSIFDVNVAVDEACSNIMKYTKDDKYPINFCLTLNDSQDKIIILIKNKGVEFNPLMFTSPDLTSNLEHRPIGGLGIFFMKQVLDDLEYEFKAGENILKMTKLRPQAKT